MKFIYTILIFFVFLSCKSSHTASSESRQISPDINCPEEGNCVFEVLKNSSLEIKQDEFGKLYPKIVPGDKMVIKYHFKKNEVKNAADSNYSEFVYLEIDKSDERLILKDKELQKVKMLFGRICFCRDSMGYFKVTEGNLFLFNNNGKFSMNLKFKVNKVPQIITEINENINY